MAEKNIERAQEVIRLIDRDVDASFSIYFALTRITGVNWMFSNAIIQILGLDKNKKLKELSEEELSKIEEVIKNPSKYGIPSWLYNHRKDLFDGKDYHYYGSDLKLRTEFDIRRLKKIRTYRGVRHSMNLPVRGQTTKTHFKQMKRRGKKGAVVYKKK